MTNKVSRRETNHEQYLQEKAWFDGNTPAFCDRVEVEIKLYQDLIWENPSDVFIKKYGNTVAEMAILCGQENNGWLLSSHIEWLLQKTNERSPDCLCLCIPTMSTNTVKEQLNTKDCISRLIFVMNVGKNDDGTVFIASSQQPGNHWVLAIIEFENDCVLYCDSLGWNVPSLLCEKLSSYTEGLNLPSLNKAQVVTMHSPSLSNDTHSCTDLCRHYPLQSCTYVCGIVAVVFGIVAALDHNFFTFFVATKSSSHKHLLNGSNEFERHLQITLISWYMREDVDVSLLKERCLESISDLEHNYCYQSVPPTKDMAMTQNDELSPQPPQRRSFQCPFCTHVVFSHQALYSHKKNKHKEEIKNKPNGQSSHCELCTEFQTSRVKDLITHYNEVHGQNIEICTKSFCSESEFQAWKQKIETESVCHFSRSNGSSVVRGVSIKYLYCHRSGHTKSVAQRKRSQKSQGSCKIDNKCTAFMTVRRNQNDGTVSVEYCLHHIGHSFKLDHLHISNEMRSTIAGRLCQGEEVSEILDDLRDKMTDADRDSLITRRDIHNIKKQYNIFQTEKHKDDSQSVHLWVEEFEKQADNPIIYYKAQNTAHKVLGEEDFLLCIQTDFQRSMLLEQAPRAVYMESTHDIAQYGFSLTTVLVLDEYDEGVPVAWAISNREDCEILQVFIAAIQNSCQNEIKVDIFISDLADSFYNSWCKVFPRPAKRLYCSWHVDKSWCQEINSSVKSETDQRFLYSFLKELQTESDEIKCKGMLNHFLDYVKEHTPTLLDYFYQNYVLDDKFCLWGGCFRVGTSLFTEAFQRVLKDIYFEIKQNQRVDHLLMVLLKVARDKAIDQLIKLQKGKVSHRLREIREGHNAAMNVKDIVKSPMANRWIVSSSTKGNQMYTIDRVMDKKCGCKLVCDSCDVCVHMYMCTCHDFLHRSILCKHIHAVQKSLNVTIKTGEGSQEKLCDFPGENLDSFKTVLCKSKPENSQDIERVRAEFTSEMSKLLDIGLKCNDIECLKVMRSQIRNSVRIVNGMVKSGDVDKKKKSPKRLQPKKPNTNKI